METAENARKKFINVFKSEKAIIGMVPAKGDTEREKVDIAKKEVSIMEKNGVDAVLVQNTFGQEYDVENILQALETSRISIPYGVSILNRYSQGCKAENMNNDEKRFGYISKAYSLARKYGAKFVYTEYVAGHLPPDLDAAYGNFINRKRVELDNANILLLGGVWDKDEPRESKRSLEDDLRVGMKRSDVIVVKGEGKDLKADLKRIKAFITVCHAYPTIGAGGLTADNCFEILGPIDGALVGKYFREGLNNHGNMVEGNVKEVMNNVKILKRFR